MTAGRLKLDGSSIRLEHAGIVLDGGPIEVTIPKSTVRAIRASRRFIDEHAAQEKALYGINTGFGKLANRRIDAAELDELQENLLLSHASGVGDPLPDGVARLALLLRANTLARGHSGVRLEVVERLLALFDRGVVPTIPSQGSVGASGDLAPLSHMALLLIGRGEARLGGRRASGKALAKQLGLEPLRLKAKEGLALINGTQISTAIAARGVLAARRLAKTADIAVAMTIEGLRGSIRPFDPRVHEIRPHPGQVTIADNVRRLLRGSRILPSHKNCTKVQDPYSLRCAPQVHGAARDAIDYASDVIEREMNCVTDNPLIFAEDGDVISGGNFHAEPVAMAADFCAIALAELGNISERRTENMVNPDLSGLPAFLAPNPGLHSGFMIAQVAAAALVSENKTLAHPASVDTVPTSAGKEDHVSMATWAARKLVTIADNVEKVLAIELLAAAQALDLYPAPRLAPGRGVAPVYDLIRAKVRTWSRDREMSPDIEAVRRLIASGAVVAAAEDGCGALR